VLPMMNERKPSLSREIKRRWKRAGNGSVRLENGDEYTVEQRGIPLREWAKANAEEGWTARWFLNKSVAKKRRG